MNETTNGSNEPKISEFKPKTLVFKIPYRLLSESNLSEHWTKKHKRHKQEQKLISYFIPKIKFTLPCTVKLTRIAPRNLDYSNLVAAFKNLQDVVADRIIPGLAPGRADGDPRITWSYHQENGRPRQYEIHIEITCT